MFTFEGAELTIYTEEGEELNIPLNYVQICIIIKALGITNISSTNYSCFGDKALNEILEGKTNPFTLVPIIDHE